ncbi:hypothetical protein [Rheinheimera aquimaris]|nr:hypothetical protein [Rheinheimera aquimaris]MCD1597818.1 hypothetical protein [Rheinheimera aquimaris]
MGSDLMLFWIVIGLMIASGISGAYCGFKLDAATPLIKMVKWIAISAGISISVVAVYLLIEYPKTSYGQAEEYNKSLHRTAYAAVE